MPVQLVIKAPNQKILDQTIECDPNWDVLRLKTHLAEVYPTNPKPEEQRLIYAGRLIKDHLTLKDFINFEEGQKSTLHLVCSQHTSSPLHRTIPTPAVSPNVPNPSQSERPTLRHRVPPSSPQPNDNSPGISHHGNSLPAGVQLGGAGGVGMTQELVAQQMAAMQHIYAQYMAQFMQQAQLAGFPAAYPDLTSAGLGVNPVAANPAGTNPPVAAADNAAVPANGNQAVANQNVRMNAQGGPLLDDEEDDAEHRDWLDWFYICSRALVLFSILFFYSSLGRFMVVAGVTILIYMYQGGWFGVRPPQQPPQQQQQQVQAPEDPDRAELDNAAANQEPVSSPELEDAQREAPVIEDPVEINNMMDLMDGVREPDHHGSEPNVIQTFWMFFTSFFASLIPEQPPPVNIN